MDLVPLDEVFLIRRVDRRLGHRKVDTGRRRMPVWDGDEIMHRRIGRDLQCLRQASAPVDVGLQDIESASRR